MIRTNGINDSLSVDFRTVDGTATNGFQYAGTSGTLEFGNGEVRRDIIIPIKNDHLALGNLTFTLLLSNPLPLGLTSIVGPAAATVTILESDCGVKFDGPFASVDEPLDDLPGSITIAVSRVGPANGEFTVLVTSSDDTAKAGTNYGAVSTPLHFANSEMHKTFPVSIFHDHKVMPVSSFHLNLSTANPLVQIVQPQMAVIINEGDTAYSFATNSFVVSESGNSSVASALITVVRSGSTAQTGAVSFATLNGTALAGTNYTAASGVLNFAVGQTYGTFLVSLMPESKVEGDHTVLLSLSNPINGQFMDPANAGAVLTILDVDTSFRFSSPSYSTTKCGGICQIEVVRKGLLGGTNFVDFGTFGGTNYYATNGTLRFNPGETTKTFSVLAADDSIISGDSTVQLNLSNPTGGASIEPPAAYLTITECHGTYVVAAGQALTDESVKPMNGVINTNERVTVWLGLRSLSAGTTNLVATLLATNGIVNPVGQSGSSSTYGALLKGGHTVAMPFTFTAAATNNQTIQASLRLEDRLPNSTNYNFDIIKFNFTIGGSNLSWARPGLITINDFTTNGNGVASPYASTNVVAGFIGNLSDLSVSLLGVAHTYPKEINVLLVGPSGDKVVLMSHCGTNLPISGVNLTFDDRASGYLPQLTGIVSGTNRPSAFGFYSDRFPLPAPSGGYGTNLSVFNGSSPNGEWKLYVVDDKNGDMGFITNGWSLSFSLGMPVPSSADLGVTLSQSAASCVVSNPLTYTVTVTNYGPAQAASVVITNILPASAQLVSGTNNLISNTNGVLVYSLAALPMPETNATGFKYYGTAFAIQIKPALEGTATNILAASNQNDPNADNNWAASLAEVVSPAVDLDVSLVVTTNLAYPGDLLTNWISIINHGPSKATAITLEYDLPPMVVFSSLSPQNPYGLTNNVFTMALPELDVDAQWIGSIVVRAVTPGTAQNQVFVTCSLKDSVKDNNNPDVKIVVNGPPSVTIARTSGGSPCITWPIGGNFTLLSCTNLLSPSWKIETNVGIVNGQWSLPITYTNKSTFFRLKY